MRSSITNLGLRKLNHCNGEPWEGPSGTRQVVYVGSSNNGHGFPWFSFQMAPSNRPKLAGAGNGTWNDPDLDRGKHQSRFIPNFRAKGDNVKPAVSFSKCSGWTKSCTAWKLWETILWFLQGNHPKPGSLRWCEWISSIHPKYRVLGKPHGEKRPSSAARNCPAGWALTLPPCHAPPREGPVFSVVVPWAPSSERARFFGSQTRRKVAI